VVDDFAEHWRDHGFSAAAITVTLPGYVPEGDTSSPTDAPSTTPLRRTTLRRRTDGTTTETSVTDTDVAPDTIVPDTGPARAIQTVWVIVMGEPQLVVDQVERVAPYINGGRC